MLIFITAKHTKFYGNQQKILFLYYEEQNFYFKFEHTVSWKLGICGNRSFSFLCKESQSPLLFVQLMIHPV